MENPSHIVPVMVGDPVHCKAVTDTLLTHYRIYVQPINYPTVKRGTERMRFTPSPVHTDAEIAVSDRRAERAVGGLPCRQGRVCETRRGIGGTSRSRLVSARAISAAARYCSDALPWQRGKRGRFAATALRGLAARPGLCGRR